MRDVLFCALGVALALAYPRWDTYVGMVFSNLESSIGGYHETSAFAHFEKNKCVATGDYFDGMEVQVNFKELDGAVGRWIPSQMTIDLSPKGGMDVDTVAHEVFHFVEDVMEWYDIKDPHYGAYLQGNWTDCVWQLVLHEQEKDKPAFNFLSN